MQKPTIHLNGTSRESLADMYEASASAVWAALRVLEQSGPNARDYYVQSDIAFTAAVKEHRARLEALHNIHEELMELWESVVPTP